MKPTSLHLVIKHILQKQLTRQSETFLEYLDANVITLSPNAVLVANIFVCEICNKGSQGYQNLQHHKKGHNLSWKLRQRSSKDVKKKVYVCPKFTCAHHDHSRGLRDLTEINKHCCRVSVDRSLFSLGVNEFKGQQ
nr:zf-C2H2_jaz domain-containing protein [Ipomoea batatas]